MMAESHRMPVYLPEHFREEFAYHMAAISNWANGRGFDPALCELLSARQCADLELSLLGSNNIKYRDYHIYIKYKYKNHVKYRWTYIFDGWEYCSLEEVFAEVDRRHSTAADLADRLIEAWDDWRCRE